MLSKLAVIDECLASRKLMVADDGRFHVTDEYYKQHSDKYMEHYY